MTAPAPPPEHWEADVVLRDGSVAQLRPITPDDATAFVDFYARVSGQSKYYRFFAPYPVLSKRDVQRFTTVDHHDRVALVVTLRSEMIAVGRYDALGADAAEVAFLVQDDYQGRGVGQLLLEHLAQAGRECGFARFVAEVLPDNDAMIAVFREQGYRLVSGYTDGVLRLEFSIDPTDTAIGVMQAREHRAEAASVQRILHPRSVAVVGAGRQHDTIGQALIRNLLRGDFCGRLYAVNPHGEPMSGLPAYSTVQQIPDEVDLAVVAVPAEAVPDVVLDCAVKGVHGLVVVSSGFAEIGDEGRRRQRHLVGQARSHGLRLIGPNCLGVFNTDPSIRLNASLSPVLPSRGRAGFFCQSGALGLAILDSVHRRGLGLTTFVSAGNRADVSGNDLLQYWEEDAATEVVLLYLESIGNPRKFSRIARRVGRRKPIVAVKSGRTTQGVPVGHAVRRSPLPPAAVDAIFEQAGVVQVDTLEEMLDVAQLLAGQPLPRGQGLAVIGNSDALGLLAVDAATAAGLQVGRLITLRAEAVADDYHRALTDAVADPAIDAMVAIYVPPIETSGAGISRELVAVAEESDKPLVATFVPDATGAEDLGSVPSYSAPEVAVRALAHAVAYSTWLARPTGQVAELADIRPRDAREVVRDAVAGGTETTRLSSGQLREVLDAYGIDLWQRIEVATLEEAVAGADQLGWNVVLKATAEHLRNRPDLAHVRRSIDSADKMAAAWGTLSDLIDAAATAGFVVQRTAAPGVPVSVESLEDPLFGPIVSFGVCGAPSDLLADRSYRIPPLTDADADAMVREIKSAPLLFGHRGSPLVDLAAVADLVQRVARLKNDLPEVSRLDLDLVLAGAGGATVLHATGAAAVASDARSDWYVRRMNRPPGVQD
ncbi:MAG: GNAT family N-acetyltransferase [Nocardioidaceae bacterium]